MAPNENKLSDDATVVDNTERRLDVKDNDEQIPDASKSGSGDSSSASDEGDNEDEMKGTSNDFFLNVVVGGGGVRYNDKDQQLTPRSKLQADTRPTAMVLPTVRHNKDLVLRLTFFSFIDSICIINAIVCRIVELPKMFGVKWQ